MEFKGILHPQVYFNLSTNMISKALLITTILLFTCKTTLAQTPGQPGNATTAIRICTPSRGQAMTQKVLFVVFLKGTEIMRSTNADSTKLNGIKPDNIKKINVLTYADAIKKYGPAAGINVVIEVELKEEKYPNGYPKPATKDTLSNKNKR